MINLREYGHPEEVKRLLAACMWPDDERIAAEYTRYMTVASRELLGKLRDHRLVGLIGMVKLADGEVELKHIAIDADYRGQGIGRKLIASYMTLNNVSKITAETDNDAVGFYRSIGCDITSLGEKYPGVERFQCTLWRETIDEY